MFPALGSITMSQEFQMDVSNYLSLSLKAPCTSFDYCLHLFLLYFKYNSDAVHITPNSHYLCFYFCPTRQ